MNIRLLFNQLPYQCWLCTACHRGRHTPSTRHPQLAHLPAWYLGQGCCDGFGQPPLVQANTSCDNLILGGGGAEDGKGRRQGFSFNKYICVIILKFILKDYDDVVFQICLLWVIMTPHFFMYIYTCYLLLLTNIT